MRDKLLYATSRARLFGSAKTRFQHRSEATRFVAELRAAGHGVQAWDKVTNKHVATVVERWKQRGLSNATMKEYLSGVRMVARAYGNTSIRSDNDFRAADGTALIGARVYVDSQNRAVPDAVYAGAVASLRAGQNDERRFAVHLELMREGGLRHEEARKLNPFRCVLQDGRIWISDGTKGGRERMQSAPSAAFLAAIERAKEFVSRHGNLMPDGTSERSWEKKAYAIARAVGLSKASCGASLHGLRHGWAHARYLEMTGFPCRAAGGVLADAQATAGASWWDLDRDARLVIKAELGHGPDRDDVVARYLGARFW